MKTFDEAIETRRTTDDKAKEISQRWDSIIDEIWNNPNAREFVVQIEHDFKSFRSLSVFLFSQGKGGATAREVILDFALNCFANGVTVGIEMEKGNWDAPTDPLR